MIDGSGIRLTPNVGSTEAAHTLDVGLHAYADAAFADRPGSQASTGAHIVTAAGLPLIWKTKKQPLVTLSTTEAEFINLTPCGSSVIWINNILTEAGHPQRLPILMFTDSANARHKALNPLQTARTKYIDLCYKWIIDRVKNGYFRL